MCDKITTDGVGGLEESLNSLLIGIFQWPGSPSHCVLASLCVLEVYVTMSCDIWVTWGEDIICVGFYLRTWAKSTGV